MTFFVAATDHSPVTHVVPHPLHAEPLFRINVGGGDMPMLNIHDGWYEFYITNHLVMSAVAALTVLLVFGFVAMRVRPKGDGISAFKTKGSFAQLFETICVFIREEVARPNLGAIADKYIYYIWTIFFFVLFCNVMGLIPIGYIAQSVTGDNHHSHWGGTATGNLSLNIVLAIGTFVAIIFIGIRETGVKAFFGHFNPIGWDNPKMLLIGIPLYVLEWIGLFIKILVLAMRLFGTMMAGHLVIAAFVGLVFMAAEASTWLGYGVGLSVILGGIVLTLLELFICLLQAFIFTFLTVLFISMTASHHDEHDEDHHGEERETDATNIAEPAKLGSLVTS